MNRVRSCLSFFLQDQLGDTCLHYAVARHNAMLVELLLQKCQADVNGGDQSRPSVLDVFRFSLEDAELNDRSNVDAIEQCLQSRFARHRCRLQRKNLKRKRSLSDAEPTDSIAVHATDDLSRQLPIDRARHYAQLASVSNSHGDLLDARENYRRAMQCLPRDAPDRAIYAHRLGKVYMDLSEHSSALELLREALALRKRFEEDTEDVHQLQRSIDQIQQHLTSQTRHPSVRESNP